MINVTLFYHVHKIILQLGVYIELISYLTSTDNVMAFWILKTLDSFI